VNHGIGHRRSAAQAFRVFEATAMNLSPGGGKSVGARRGPRKTKHLMAPADQLLCDSKAYKSRSSRNENTHVALLSGLTRFWKSDKMETVSAYLD
jgi:hypothetical protein